MPQTLEKAGKASRSGAARHDRRQRVSSRRGVAAKDMGTGLRILQRLAAGAKRPPKARQGTLCSVLRSSVTVASIGACRIGLYCTRRKGPLRRPVARGEQRQQKMQSFFG
jgi:hypothetical protein